MKTILNICNSESAYGTLRKTFKNCENVFYLFGDNKYYNFQINRTLCNLDGVLDSLSKPVDLIRIWFTKRNINECIFVGVLLSNLKNLNNVQLINVDSYNYLIKGKKKISKIHSLGEVNSELFLKSLELENVEHFDFKKVLDAFNQSMFVPDKMLMIKNDTDPFFVTDEEIKNYIIQTVKKENGLIKVRNLIGIVMGNSIELDWSIEDHVIYKYILDCINDGKLKLQSEFYMNYGSAMSVVVREG